ncbi:MAG: GNAT family N-acetyltransferase, partial [Flavisolibacter sp.]
MTSDCGTFILRPLIETDKDSLVKYGNNRSIWRNMRNIFPHPYKINDAEKMIERFGQSTTVFCIEYDQECIGVIGCFPQTDVYSKSAELGYWLAVPFWSKGIMRIAVQKICEYIFRDFDIVRIYANVYQWNPASMKVLENAGFQFEGISRKSVFKDGELIDEYRYALISSEQEAGSNRSSKENKQ